MLDSVGVFGLFFLYTGKRFLIQVGILWSAPVDNGGSEVLSYKVRLENQAGKLTSFTVDAEDVWTMQELLVREARRCLVFRSG